MRQFNTLTGFLLSATSDPTINPLVNVKGYTTSGDSGDGDWLHNGVTGQTASQSPIQLADGLANDASGNQYALVDAGRFHVKSLGVVGDGVADDYIAINACLNHSEATSSIMQGGGLTILCGGKLLIGDNVSINMPTDTFSKDFDSGDANTDALFTNKSYAVLGTPNLNISIDGLNIVEAPATTTGALISLNWINGLKFKNFNLTKDSTGWCTHLSGKNMEISKGIIYTLGASSVNADGLHFEYCENVIVSDVNIETQDDCISFQYQPGTNSSAGPNLGSKNIVVTNCNLSSSIANGVRIGAGSIGDVTASDTVVANALWDGIVISNIVINKLGATGRSLALYDERTNAIAPHDNISISNVTMNDSSSVAGQIQIIGNQDITDNANIGVKNYGTVKLNNFNMVKSGGGQWSVGGVDKLIIDNLSFVATDANTHPIDCRQITNLHIKNSYISTLATARLALVRDIQEFTWENNKTKVIDTTASTIQLEQPTITDADIFIKNNTFEEGVATFATISAPGSRTFHHIGNSRVSVTNTTTGTITATASKVVDDYN